MENVLTTTVMDFNPHPPLTGFPIVLATLILASEMLAVCFKAKAESFRKFGRSLLLATCLFSPLTYYSGYWGAEHASKTFLVSEEIIADHQMFAKIYLIAMSLCALLMLLNRELEKPNKWFRAAYTTSIFALFVTSLLVSKQGGALVFKHGAGVNASSASSLVSRPGLETEKQ